MVVKTLAPRDYNEALHVGHYFRQGVPVIMDLTAMANAEAMQLIDFAAGLVVGRGGDMQRVDTKVFLLLPLRTAKSA
ncbi:cell division protein SepF [Actinomadura kijaniata]|uniref:cell division protein SepF n=1 Tax=Actinomadura kijaniata TaxID=46161 RepID=UPI000AF18084|nr:cell division protein SepF [Actinomadura kijaniata]